MKIKEKTLAEIQLLLNAVGIESSTFQPKEVGFNRTISFRSAGIMIRIEWYKNVSYLKIGKGERPMIFPFTHVKLDETFPMKISNRNLHFYNRSEDNFDGFHLPLD